jgi:hypothetical protein
VLTDEQAGLLVRVSAATIDRRLASERAKPTPRMVPVMNSEPLSEANDGTGTPQ